MAPVALTGAGNVTSATSNSADTLIASKPANVSDGDLLWAAVYFRNSGASLTPPAGWTLAKGDNGNATVGLYVKPIPSAASETATNYTFSTSGAGSSRCMLFVGRITGADLASPVDAAGVASLYTGTSSLEHPSVTAVASGCLLLAVSSCNLNTTPAPIFTPDAAMTEVAQDDAGSGSSSSMQVAQEALASAGATGTRTATLSPAANNSVGFMVTIAPGIVGGTGTITATATLTGSASKSTSGTGAISGVATVTGTGTSARSSTGAIVATATLTGVGATPLPVAPEIPAFHPGIPVGSAPAAFNELIRDPFTALLSPPMFRARRTGALAVVENTVQAITWDTVDEDPYEGWSAGAPAQWTVPDGWSGWWAATCAVSLSGTGASGLAVIPSISVGGKSQINPAGSAWEGQEVFVPTGAAAVVKTVSSSWSVYAAAGDVVVLNLWYSTESTITAVDVTPGLECRLELVWDGV